ncbi:plastid alpha-amylase, partial [Genlisea aurea]
SLPKRAVCSTAASGIEVSESADIVFEKDFSLKRSEKMEGKIITRLESGNEENSWQLFVGCTLPGNWILHWGVNHLGDAGREWDQPPMDMRPPGSIAIKHYAIETPLEKQPASSDGETFYQLKIDSNAGCSIAAISFVLKDEETGFWYQNRGRDFKVLLSYYPQDEGNGIDNDENLILGTLGKISNFFLKTEDHGNERDSYRNSDLKKMCLRGSYEEHSISKERFISNSIQVCVRHCPERDNIVVDIETDLPGDVVVHWGVSRDGSRNWEIPDEPYPPETVMFKYKALQTSLRKKDDGNGSKGSFPLHEEGLSAFMFVLKINESTWLNCEGNDFFVPLSSSSVVMEKHDTTQFISSDEGENGAASHATSESDSSNTDGIINDIRDLVSDISSTKSLKSRSKAIQETILQEIEKLAAEAYGIFRSSMPKFIASSLLEDEDDGTAVKISSGTGSGFEILLQGFNWESHKSGRWYMELHDKAPELSKLGFTVIWLPPPTDSVSPEGYMPTDLYNLNSRYGSVDELKTLIKRLKEVGIKVLGDVVLNHRCAQYRNKSGIWNIFGGRLNWDDRAVVSDDPNFQGRGNRSSGDFFHAAPNIDHSQDFVRKDIKEWMRWLREEIGYDGWRFDFVRGFWGGYVKEYMGATEPYFAVGEFWDSLSYTYGQMDRNQDAHRQRIIDWINATNGTSGAFDVTTKGILHSALERCEYWRLSDEKRKPPGVLGWWPSRAVTFIENHDTGSTQGHWRFPQGKEMQGYAYILTHPGTPSVFYDHVFFSPLRDQIASLIRIRTRNRIHCRSIVKILKADKDVYAAMIDEKLVMKIGPGYYEPPPLDGRRNCWTAATDGRQDYRIWEIS